MRSRTSWRQTAGAAAIVISILFVGCGGPVRNTLIRYPEMAQYQRDSKKCDVELVWEEEAASVEGCQPIADIYVGELGTSGNCGRFQMMKLTRRTACKTPADFGVMKQIPDGNSSCTNIRTQLYACREPENDNENPAPSDHVDSREANDS